MRGWEHFAMDLLLAGDGQANKAFAKAANRTSFWKEISMIREITKGRRAAQMNDPERFRSKGLIWCSERTF
jgi:hypothetical protein